MAYLFYMDGVLLPVTPSKLEIKINGMNETIDLINEGEANVIKDTGLTDISFECIIPQLVEYPFENKIPNRPSASEYLGIFENLKKRRKPFPFKVIRTDPAGNNLFDTNYRCTMENYTITEDAENGFDILIDVELKQWRDYGCKKLVKVPNVGRSGVLGLAVGLQVVVGRPEKDAAKIHRVVKGESLMLISKKEFGTTEYHKEIYRLNKKAIEGAAKRNGRKSSSGGFWIYPGTVLKLPEKKR